MDEVRSLATYETGYALQNGRVRKAGLGSFLLRFGWLIIGLAGSGILAIFFWPAGLIIAALNLVYFASRPRATGLWHGNCPLCQSETWYSAPALAEGPSFSCPSCTRTLVLSGGQFVGKIERRDDSIHLRLSAALLDGLDRWIAERPSPRPSRPEAIRQMIASHVDEEPSL